MFVVFEGLDKAGKGTLELEFLKATNFKHIVIDRGPAGYLAFDSIFKRQTEEGVDEFASNAQTMMETNSFMVVYCRAPVEVAIKRIVEHNETCPYDYKVAQSVYDWCVGSLYDMDRVVVIDTTKPIEECVNEIIKKMEVLKGEHD